MGPFDEVWVMARSRDRLEALKGTVPYMPTGSHILNLAWRDAKRNRDRSRFGAVARLQGLLAKLLPHSFVMSYWMKQQKLQ